MNPPTDREAQVVAFFGAWGESFDALCESMALLGDDGVWDQRPIPRLRGSRSAVRFMNVARRTMALDRIEVEVVSIASKGDLVLTERVDRLRRADGSLIAAAPVAGVLTFSNDQLVYWREYFDAQTLAGQALANTVSNAVRRATRRG